MGPQVHTNLQRNHPREQCAVCEKHIRKKSTALYANVITQDDSPTRRSLGSRHTAHSVRVLRSPITIESSITTPISLGNLLSKHWVNLATAFSELSAQQSQLGFRIQRNQVETFQRAQKAGSCSGCFVPGPSNSSGQEGERGRGRNTYLLG